MIEPRLNKSSTYNFYFLIPLKKWEIDFFVQELNNVGEKSKRLKRHLQENIVSFSQDTVLIALNEEDIHVLRRLTVKYLRNFLPIKSLSLEIDIDTLHYKLCIYCGRTYLPEDISLSEYRKAELQRQRPTNSSDKGKRKLSYLIKLNELEFFLLAGIFMELSYLDPYAPKQRRYQNSYNSPNHDEFLKLQWLWGHHIAGTDVYLICDILRFEYYERKLKTNLLQRYDRFYIKDWLGKHAKESSLIESRLINKFDEIKKQIDLFMFSTFNT